jgi:hypothetical protein
LGGTGFPAGAAQAQACGYIFAFSQATSLAKNLPDTTSPEGHFRRGKS